MFKSNIERKAHALIMRHSSTSAAIIALEEDGTSPDIAENVVLSVIMTMIAGAPNEIRGSVELVISWWRWNEIYELARSRNNIKQMTFAQSAIDALLRSVHS